MAIYKLKELFISKPKYGLNLPSRSNGELIYLTQSEMNSNVITKRIPIVPDFEKFLVNKNDVFLSRAGTIDSYYCNSSTKKMVFAGYLVRYKFNEEKLLHKYFYYWTKHKKTKKLLENLSKTGTTMPKLNPPIVGEILIDVPNIDIQNQIISIIEPFEKLCMLISRKITNLERAYSKVIDMDCVSLGTMKSNEIIFEKGKTYKGTEFVELGIPFVNISYINNNLNKFLPTSYENELNIKYGDVVLSLDGNPGIVNNHISGINGYGYKVWSNKFENWQIYFSLINRSNQKIINSNSTGTTIMHSTNSKKYLELFQWKNSIENLLKKVYLLEIKYHLIKNLLGKIKENLILLFID